MPPRAFFCAMNEERVKRSCVSMTHTLHRGWRGGGGGREGGLGACGEGTRQTGSPTACVKKSRVRIGVSLGNQKHSSNLWTLMIPKMYIRTLGYNVQISVKKFPTLSNFSVKFGHCNLGFSYTFLESPGSIDYCYVFGFPETRRS